MQGGAGCCLPTELVTGGQCLSMAAGVCKGAEAASATQPKLATCGHCLPAAAGVLDFHSTDGMYISDIVTKHDFLVFF